MNPYEEADRLRSGEYDRESPSELYERFNRLAMTDRPLAIDIIDLQRKVFARRVEIENRDLYQMRHSSEFRSWEDRAKDRLVIEMRTTIYGKDHPTKHVIRFPADWLEAVKERFAPAWVRDRWPVKFTEITASLEETYTGIEQSIPDRPAVMRVHVRRDDCFPVW